MKLPNAERAVVDLAKITDYLLNASHPDNGGKARFFSGLGFKRVEPGALAEALCVVAVSGDVVANSESPHGRKFVVDGAIQSSSGRRSSVRTIWIIETGHEHPRLVTAYPGGE